MAVGTSDHGERAIKDPQATSSGMSARKIVIGLVGVLLLAAYLTPILLLLQERLQPNTLADDHSHAIALDMKIATADFVKGVVTLHIVPEGGSLLKQNGRLSRDVTIETDPGTGLLSHTFRADTPLTPWVVTASSDAGDIFDYPFDRYRIDLEISAHAEGQPIALATAVDDVPHGFRARSQEHATAVGEVNVQVHVSRTGTIIFVALLSTISLIIVAVAACAVAWHVAMRDRKLEFSMLVWAAALLFVIPAVRTTLPGSVPVGALIDYIVFFWLQIAIAAIMAMLVVAWVRRTAA